MDDLHREYIDVEAEAEFKRGPYEGTRSLDTKRFRVVGVRTDDADDYHLYITNLPREEFLPADLATLYQCRWEVELLFRELAAVRTRRVRHEQPGGCRDFAVCGVAVTAGKP